jgi:DNA phosphorothioation-dependent restriction protein DptG
MEWIFNKETGLKSYWDRKGEEDPTWKSHSSGKKILLFPYSTNKKSGQRAADSRQDLRSFNGCIGECFRITQRKVLPKDFTEAEDYREMLKNRIIANVTNQVSCSELDSFKLKSIVGSLFFEENNLTRFGISAFPYMNWMNTNPGLQDMAAFIFRIFFDEKVEKALQEQHEQAEHIFIKLIRDSLPELEQKQYELPEYFNLAPEVKACFWEDFFFLVKEKNKKRFLQEFDKLLKYYYFYYVSQAAMRLNDFFKPSDLSLYFTLEEETFSDSRKAFHGGWNKLEYKVGNLFSHTICLDMLNHLRIPGLEGPFDYYRLQQAVLQLPQEEEQAIINKILELGQVYRTWGPVPEDRWEGFELYLKKHLIFVDAKDALLRAVLSLWYSIDYQFHNSKGSRLALYNFYADWFRIFCAENFLKRRGRNGYSLNLNHEMLFFLTNLCVGDREKIRLKELWRAFEKRGISFDDASRTAIVRLFEKINLIEKKSDSGDAQYVKCIL